MGRLVNFFQFSDRDLGVNLGSIELGMAKHGLNVPCVGSIFEHQRRHRVAEQMARARLADGRLVDVLTDQERHG